MKKILLFCLCITAIFTMTSCNTKSKYENIYIDINEPEISSEGITWPDGQALPTFAAPAETVDAIDVRSKSADVKTLLVSLQGIVNRKQPRIALYSDSLKNEEWLEESGINYEIVKEYDDIILKYKDEIKGIIIWDKGNRDTINLADTLAGQTDAIVCSAKQAETYTAEPFNFPIIEDYTDRFEDKMDVYNYLYDNLWKDCTRKMIVSLNPAANGHIANTRDVAIATKAAVLWLDPTVGGEKAILEKFLKDCVPGESYCLGWWTSEGDGVKIGSEYGMPTVPADFYENYSVLAGASRELDIPTIPAKPELENKFYIAMAFSDGDNLQYCQHHMKTHQNMWSNTKDRGKYPISWTCAPTLLDAGPQLLNYYYRTATENDCLITGPSGVGYTDPLVWQTEYASYDELIKYAKRTDTYLRRTAFNVITIWNFIRDDQASIYAKYIPSMVGFTVQERLDFQEGQYVVDNTVPLITTHPRYDGDIDRVERIISEVIDAWDGSEPGFMIPQIVAWERGVSDLNRLADNLKEKYGDKVEFVRADHLMMLYNEAHGAPYNVALRAENVTASGEDEGFGASQAVDGSFAKAKGWQSSASGDKWIMIDLKEEYNIVRYNVMHAATGYYSKDLNTVEFKIQASSDGEKWKDIDTVTDNTSNIVDKYVDEFTARYVRIYITDPGADGVARIQEFEVYGNKA